MFQVLPLVRATGIHRTTGGELLAMHWTDVFIGLFKNIHAKSDDGEYAWVGHIFLPWFALFIAWLFTFLI